MLFQWKVSFLQKKTFVYNDCPSFFQASGISLSLSPEQLSFSISLVFFLFPSGVLVSLSLSLGVSLPLPLWMVTLSLFLYSRGNSPLSFSTGARVSLFLSISLSLGALLLCIWIHGFSLYLALGWSLSFWMLPHFTSHSICRRVGGLPLWEKIFFLLFPLSHALSF